MENMTIVIEKVENGYLEGKIKEKPHIKAKASNFEKLMELLRAMINSEKNVKISDN